MTDLERALEKAQEMYQSTTIQNISLKAIRNELNATLEKLNGSIARNQSFMEILTDVVPEYEKQVAALPKEPTKEEIALEAERDAREMRSIQRHHAAQEAAQKAAPKGLPEVVQVKNSIQALFSAQSPLLDIFAPSPWLPDGRGRITVGSKGFQWDQTTDVSKTSPEENASLPTGFYGMGDQPDSVVLRMKTCILMWNFQLDPFHAVCYIVGLSDKSISNCLWYRANALSATFAKQLYQEIANEAARLKG